MNISTTFILISQLCIIAIASASSSSSSLLRGTTDQDIIDHQHNQRRQRELESTSFGVSNDVRDVNTDKDDRIIGGSAVANDDYSYTVSLQDQWGPFCGGSLLAKDIVLTAAHCKQEKEFKIVVNRRDSSDESEGEEITIPPENQIVHPKYDEWRTNYDFMIIKLPKRTTETVQLVKVGNYHLPSATPVTVVGWGVTRGGQMSDQLMEVEVNVVSNEVCEAAEGYIGGYDFYVFGTEYNIGGTAASYEDMLTDKMMCAADNGEDACQGDSGGPLVYKSHKGHLQVGIVSWGHGCADKDFPGVYAKVSAEYDWIRKMVCRESDVWPLYFDCENRAW